MTATSTAKPASETTDCCSNQPWSATNWSNWTSNAFRNPFAFGNEAFVGMTKTMNGMIDCNARLMTETNALVVDAMRANARTLERTGDLVLNAVACQMAGEKASPKNAKPATETAREILDDACAFASKTTERALKLNSEYMQNVGKVVGQAFARSN